MQEYAENVCVLVHMKSISQFSAGRDHGICASGAILLLTLIQLLCFVSGWQMGS